MNIIAGLLYQLWKKYVEILKVAGKEINDTLIKKYRQNLFKEFSESFFHQNLKANDFLPFSLNIDKIHK
jgi:hypothetical protein